MELFKRIPERFFSILTSPQKELYVDALFVLRQAFKTELVIKRTDLIAMMVNTLETGILEADFSEEAEELDAGQKADASLSGCNFNNWRQNNPVKNMEYRNRSFRSWGLISG